MKYKNYECVYEKVAEEAQNLYCITICSIACPLIKSQLLSLDFAVNQQHRSCKTVSRIFCF